VPGSFVASCDSRYDHRVSRIIVATVDATPVVTVRARRWSSSGPIGLTVGLGSFGVVVAAAAVRSPRSLLAALLALPFLGLAAWLGLHALWLLTGSVRIVIEPEGIVIERRYAGYSVSRQTATRAEVARLEIVKPVVREEDDTDARSFVRITTKGGAVIDVGRDLDLSDADARALGAALIRKG
jgi:hypothetical protein